MRAHDQTMCILHGLPFDYSGSPIPCGLARERAGAAPSRFAGKRVSWAMALADRSAVACSFDECVQAGHAAARGVPKGRVRPPQRCRRRASLLHSAHRRRGKCRSGACRKLSTKTGWPSDATSGGEVAAKRVVGKTGDRIGGWGVSSWGIRPARKSGSVFVSCETCARKCARTSRAEACAGPVSRNLFSVAVPAVCPSRPRPRWLCGPTPALRAPIRDKLICSLGAFSRTIVNNFGGFSEQCEHLRRVHGYLLCFLCHRSRHHSNDFGWLSSRSPVYLSAPRPRARCQRSAFVPRRLRDGQRCAAHWSPLGALGRLFVVSPGSVGGHESACAEARGAENPGGASRPASQPLPRCPGLGPIRVPACVPARGLPGGVPAGVRCPAGVVPAPVTPAVAPRVSVLVARRGPAWPGGVRSVVQAVVLLVSRRVAR